MALYLKWWDWILTLYSQFVSFISSTLYHHITIRILVAVATAATATVASSKYNNQHQCQQRRMWIAKADTTSSFYIERWGDVYFLYFISPYHHDSNPCHCRCHCRCRCHCHCCLNWKQQSTAVPTETERTGESRYNKLILDWTMGRWDLQVESHLLTTTDAL